MQKKNQVSVMSVIIWALLCTGRGTHGPRDFPELHKTVGTPEKRKNVRQAEEKEKNGEFK